MLITVIKGCIVISLCGLMLTIILKIQVISNILNRQIDINKKIVDILAKYEKNFEELKDKEFKKTLTQRIRKD